MKIITDTEIETHIPTKYFEGSLKDIRTTKMGHTFIVCDDTTRIRIVNGVKVILQRFEQDWNFIIPKRRLGIITAFKKEAKFKNNYIFKLQEESRSKKFMVSEVFESE